MSNPEKQYYSIKEVGEMLQIPLPTLRYWETCFTQLRPKHLSGTSRRFYTKDDIELLRRIKYMREEQDMRIKAVGRRLSSDLSEVERREKAVATLRELRQELVDVKKWIENNN